MNWEMLSALGQLVAAVGVIPSLIYLAIQIGTGLGSLVFGLSATAFGSYRPVLSVVALTLLVASFGMRWAVRPRPAHPSPDAA